MSTYLKAYLDIQKSIQKTAKALLEQLPPRSKYDYGADSKRWKLKLEFDKYVHDGDRPEDETFDEWRERQKKEYEEVVGYTFDESDDEDDVIEELELMANEN